MIGVIDFFEEWRFILELILAEQIFVQTFAERKRKHLFFLFAGFFILVLIATCYPFIIDSKFIGLRAGGETTFSISWYVMLTLLTLCHIKLNYHISWSDLLFLGIAGYAVQHIEYIVINEVLALGILKAIRSYFLFYFLVCAVTVWVWYSIIYYLFAKKIRDCQGVIFEDHWKSVWTFLIMLIALMFSSFSGQLFFVNGSSDYENVNYYGALYDLVSTSMILFLQYSIFRISTLSREKEIVRQLSLERKKQYTLSKENIDIINQKCHDLKHQFKALRESNKLEIDQYIEEVEKSIMIYDHVLKTDNDVLNTILTEKSLYCERHNIKLSCIIDTSQLDFISTQDLYVLFGNMLSNAIECASKQKEIEQRVISLHVQAKRNVLSIQTNNFVLVPPEFADGLPVTTKSNKAYHGFGMKSMVHIAEKYGGHLSATVNNHIFMLQIVIPIPKEYIRLLNINKDIENY